MKRILGILATLVLGVALMGCIGDGTHVVGTGIQPGTYQNSDSSAGCYWERLSGFGGTVEEIIANGFTYGPAVVTVSPTDAGFTSARCGFWTQVANAPTAVPPIAQPTELAPTAQPKATSTAQPGATDTPQPTLTPHPTALPEPLGWATVQLVLRDSNGFIAYGRLGQFSIDLTCADSAWLENINSLGLFDGAITLHQIPVCEDGGFTIKVKTLSDGVTLDWTIRSDCGHPWGGLTAGSDTVTYTCD